MGREPLLGGDGEGRIPLLRGGGAGGPAAASAAASCVSNLLRSISFSAAALESDVDDAGRAASGGLDA